MTDPITERLQECYTGVVHDVMRARGFTDFVLPPDLHPLLPDRPIAGPAFTIDGRTEPGADPHETLLAWTGLLSEAPRGHVWVCQANDDQVAHMGELSAETLQRRGVPGCIIDGGCRDLRFLTDLGFPVWRRYDTPRDIVGYWMPRATDVPVRIGGVLIHPGDYVLADRDGVCILPKAHAAEIADAAIEATQAENKVRTAILDGVDPKEAYLRFGKF